MYWKFALYRGSILQNYFLRNFCKNKLPMVFLVIWSKNTHIYCYNHPHPQLLCIDKKFLCFCRAIIPPNLDVINFLKNKKYVIFWSLYFAHLQNLVPIRLNYFFEIFLRKMSVYFWTMQLLKILHLQIFISRFSISISDQS